MTFLSTLTIEMVVLIAGFALICITLIVWHLSADVKFDLKSIVVDKNGRFSLSKFGQLVALLISTWIIIHETTGGLLTEWLFTGYMIAWSGANLIGKYLDNKGETRPYQRNNRYPRTNQPRDGGEDEPHTPRNDSG